MKWSVFCRSALIWKAEKSGSQRKKDGEWIVNSWIKEVISVGFSLGRLRQMMIGRGVLFLTR